MPHDYSDEFRARDKSLKEVVEQLIIAPEMVLGSIQIEPFTPFFRTNNVLQQTLSRLFAYYEANQEWQRLQVDAGNRLMVSTIAGSFNYNETKSGNAPDAYAAAIAFTEIATRLDVYIWTNAAYIKRTHDGAIWGDEFEVPAGVILHLDATTHSFNIKNKSAGNVARYSVVGWW